MDDYPVLSTDLFRVGVRRASPVCRLVESRRFCYNNINMKLILRWLINALALLVVAQVITGFSVDTFYHALIAALVLGLLNAIIRPLLILVTLPVNILTLGLFIFVINAFLLWFMSTFIAGVTLTGFWSAIAVAIILWAVSVVTNQLLKTNEKISA